jgi:hypothetical protein
MKKLLISLALITLFVSPVYAASDIVIKVNGQVVQTDAKPYINTENRTVVPIRFIAEALGATVDWTKETRTVTIKKDAADISLKIDESKALVNGQEKLFDTKAVIKENRTFVPLRFVSETLGAEVNWDAKTKIVDISIVLKPYISTIAGYSIETLNIQTESDGGIRYKSPSGATINYNTLDSTHNVELTLDIDLTRPDLRPLEKQYNAVYDVLKSKFGEKTSTDVLNYVKLKNNNMYNLEDKIFTADNGQKIEIVGGTLGTWSVVIHVIAQGRD